MKLLAVVVLGYLAVGGSNASPHNHHHSHKKHGGGGGGGGDQDLSDEQQTDIYGPGQGNAETMHQGYDQDGDQYYSEPGWNIWGSGGSPNAKYGETYGGIGIGIGGGGGGQMSPSEYAGFGSPSSGTLDDYAAERTDGDVAAEIGRKVAEKMVKFFAIVEKYAARNGTVLTGPVQEPLPLRQWAVPMADHHYLNMADNKIYGLSQGVVKAMYINTEMNTIDLEYFFDELLAAGNLKASTGPKGSFQLKMTNTYVNVSTELQTRNRNRNYAHTENERTAISYQNLLGAADVGKQTVGEHVTGEYVRFMNRAVESEMIDSSYAGLVGCLRSEIGSAFDMPSDTDAKLTIENKRSGLTVTLPQKAQTYTDAGPGKQRKVLYVAFRQNGPGNGGGYRLKAKAVLAERPAWVSDVIAQRAGKRVVVRNVAFHAQDIAATAVLERVPLRDGSYRFGVQDASVKLEGLRFDVGKFDVDADAATAKLAREIAQDLPQIIENGMSAALQQQLYRQQRICQQNPMDCIGC